MKRHLWAQIGYPIQDCSRRKNPCLQYNSISQQREFGLSYMDETGSENGGIGHTQEHLCQRMNDLLPSLRSIG